MATQEKGEKEPLLARWSRRKQEARKRALQDAPEPQQQAAPQLANTEPLPDLPPIDNLTIESDFRGFMDTRVDDAVRRIALKKLFSDPRFNITDGLDDYAEDYSVLEDLSAAAVDQLQHVRRTLGRAEPEDSETAESQVAEQPVEQRVELPVERPVQEQETRQLADAAPATQENKE